MPISLTIIVSTILGGLVLTGLVAWIRTDYLRVLVPRLLSHSGLTERGQLAEVTVFNRGFKTQEKIELTLSPSLRYEIVGSNTQDVAIEKNKVLLERVGPDDEVTVLLLVEGGNFTKADIVNCLSKDTKGKVVNKLEEVMPTGPQRIGIVSFILGIPILSYLTILSVDYFLQSPKQSPQVIANAEKEREQTVDIDGWKIQAVYKRVGGHIYKDFESGAVKAAVNTPTRKGDLVTVPVVIQNNSGQPLSYSLSMATNASMGKIPSYERSIHDVLISSKGSSVKSIKVLIPANSNDPSNRLILVDLFIQSPDGDSLKFNRLYSFDQ